VGLLYTKDIPYSAMSMLHNLQIPLSRLMTSGKPSLTRSWLTALANQATQRACDEVRITVVYDEDFEGIAIPLACVELNRVPGGRWRLQYVSHPERSNGLTGLLPVSQTPC